jgi:hypothetical protein
VKFRGFYLKKSVKIGDFVKIRRFQISSTKVGEFSEN